MAGRFALKKSVGHKLLTKDELVTTLCEVEACINSRPLTFVSDVTSDEYPLTPSHFLIGRGCAYEKDNQCEPDETTISKERLIQRK